MTMTQHLVDRETVIKAHSQLLSMIVGKKLATETNSLMRQPRKRGMECLKREAAELAEVAKDENRPDLQQRLDWSQRRISSLRSLETFAALIEDIDWEEEEE